MKLYNKKEQLNEIYRKYRKKLILSFFNYNFEIVDKYDKYLIKTIISCYYNENDKKLLLEIRRVDAYKYEKGYLNSLKQQHGFLTIEDLKDIKEILGIISKEDSNKYFIKKQNLSIFNEPREIYYLGNNYFPDLQYVDEDVYLTVLKNNSLYCPDDFSVKDFLEIMLGKEELVSQIKKMKGGI